MDILVVCRRLLWQYSYKTSGFWY